METQSKGKDRKNGAQLISSKNKLSTVLLRNCNLAAFCSQPATSPIGRHKCKKPANSNESDVSWGNIDHAIPNISKAMGTWTILPHITMRPSLVARKVRRVSRIGKRFGFMVVGRASEMVVSFSITVALRLRLIAGSSRVACHSVKFSQPVPPPSPPTTARRFFQAAWPRTMPRYRSIALRPDP